MTNDTQRLLARLVALVGPALAYQVFRAIREQQPGDAASESVAIVAQISDDEAEEAGQYLRALRREAEDYGDL